MAPGWVKSLRCKDNAVKDVAKSLTPPSSAAKTRPLLPLSLSCGESSDDADMDAFHRRNPCPSFPPLQLKLSPGRGAKAAAASSSSRSSGRGHLPALVQLPAGHPTRRVVETIFDASWSSGSGAASAFPGEIEMLFRVENPALKVSRFEEYRAAVRSRATPSGDARCAFDGNETMRFICRPSASASDEVYGAGVEWSSAEGIRTFAGSSEAHESCGGGGGGRRAMLLNRVIGGRVRDELDPESAGDSVFISSEDENIPNNAHKDRTAMILANDQQSLMQDHEHLVEATDQQSLLQDDEHVVEANDGQALQHDDEHALRLDDMETPRNTNVDSDEIITPETSQEGVPYTENVYTRKKHRPKVYNPNCEFKDVKFEVGMKFGSNSEFKQAVQNYALGNDYNIKWSKSNKKRKEAKCIMSCPWRIYASWLTNEKTLMVKAYTNEHSCSRNMRNRQTTRLYIGFDALRNGFLHGCRPIIGFDGYFLKIFLVGQLLSAIGRDDNNQIFPIAWVVVEGENYDSWSWFLGLLFDDLCIDQGYGWTLISD
ncbi:hypothetical protein Cni_G14384 [Canna indica]|uniref:Transposase MuDR plant domain-containing protein n=1 Tax=Canna indica TaxID=4628 RepID=A0AAQ3QEQ4_9LILI|nr:hypothetical protein Cni_G14384 [Canna indica]